MAKTRRTAKSKTRKVKKKPSAAVDAVHTLAPESVVVYVHGVGGSLCAFNTYSA
jgi:hypothetical protein